MEDVLSPLSPRMHPIREEEENELLNGARVINTNNEFPSTNNINEEASANPLSSSSSSIYNLDPVLDSINIFMHNIKNTSANNTSPIISLLLYIKQLNESVSNLLKYTEIFQLISTNKNCLDILLFLNKFNENVITHINNINNNKHSSNISNLSDVPKYNNAILSPHHSNHDNNIEHDEDIKDESDHTNHTNDASEGKINDDKSVIKINKEQLKAKLIQKEAEKRVLCEIKRRNIDENFNFFESYYVLKQETNYRLHSHQHYSGKLSLKNISRLQLLRLISNILTRRNDIQISSNDLALILRSIFHSKLNGKKFQTIQYVRFQKILNLSLELEQNFNLSFQIYNSIKKYFDSASIKSRRGKNIHDVEHYYQGRLYIDRKFIIMNDILYGNFEYEQMFKISDEKATEDEIYDAQNYGDIYRINGTNPSLLFKKIELECFDDLASVLNEQYGLKIFDENCQLYFGTEIDYDDNGDQIEYISSRLIMTEYKGSTLAEKIYDYAEENDYLTEYDIGMILYKILLAVQQTHRKNVIHCDLKPDNMIINIIENNNNNQQSNNSDHNHKKIVINLIDFGYCEIVKGKDFIIQRHLIKGTKGYISPEIFSKYKYSKKSDLYSIGCIGFEMVTGGTLPSDYDINGNYIDKDDDSDDNSDSDSDNEQPKVLDINIEKILKIENKKRKYDNRISMKLIKFITKLLTYQYDGRYDTSNAVLVARKNWSMMKPVKHRTAFF